MRLVHCKRILSKGLIPLGDSMKQQTKKAAVHVTMDGICKDRRYDFEGLSLYREGWKVHYVKDGETTVYQEFPFQKSLVQGTVAFCNEAWTRMKKALIV